MHVCDFNKTKWQIRIVCMPSNSSNPNLVIFVWITNGHISEWFYLRARARDAALLVSMDNFTIFKKYEKDYGLHKRIDAHFSLPLQSTNRQTKNGRWLVVGDAILRATVPPVDSDIATVPVGEKEDERRKNAPTPPPSTHRSNAPHRAAIPPPPTLGRTAGRRPALLKSPPPPVFHRPRPSL
jgi:hypothetical protein